MTLLQMYYSSLDEHDLTNDPAFIFFCFEHLMKYTLISMSIQHGLAITGNHEHLHEKLMSHLTGRECALAENVNRVGCMALMH